MRTIDEGWIAEFSEYVDDTEPKAVYDLFLKLLAASTDRSSENLSALLVRARAEAPGFAERSARKEGMLRSALRHFVT